MKTSFSIYKFSSQAHFSWNDLSSQIKEYFCVLRVHRSSVFRTQDNNSDIQLPQLSEITPIFYFQKFYGWRFEILSYNFLTLLRVCGEVRVFYFSKYSTNI
jgi:hypothetical protein